MMTMLDEIIANGNRGHYGYRDNSIITCADGFQMSVIAGGGTYCAPRPTFCGCAYRHLSDKFVTAAGYKDAEHDYPGPYTHVEVGFPSMRPEPWADEWSEWCEGDAWAGTVYAFVPVEAVRALVELHGGEV
jgi:hypothetical protein